MKDTSVLIIGGGPSGMVSALCFALLGIPCVIVERNEGINEHPKAHELNTRSMEILTSLGISDEELIKEAAPFKDGARIIFCKTVNEEIGRIDLYADQERRKKYEKHLKSKTPYLNLSQSELEKILLRHVEANPLINVLLNHEWKALKQTEDAVINEIMNRSNNDSFQIKSKYVLAADGAGSRCRKFLGIEMIGPDRIDDFASAYFEANLRDHIQIPAKLYWVLNPKSPGIFIAHHIEKRWVFMVPAYLDYQKKEDFTKSFFESQIKKALGDPTLDINVKSINFWRMSAQLASTYRKDRVLLVGDAAHRFPPTGGLGMNTGIADAHNIAWKINAVIRGMADSELLDTFESERRPIAYQNTEESVHNYHKILEVLEIFGLDRNGLEKLAKFKNTIPTKWLPESWKDIIQDFVTASASKKISEFYRNSELMKKVHASIADQIAHFDRIGLDIGYSYEEGALISDGTKRVIPEDKVTQYIPSTRPGSRFPHVSFSTSSGLDSSHDLLSYDYYTLLIGEKEEHWINTINNLKESLRNKIKIFEIDNLNISTEDKDQLMELCEINRSGALLIRPDGHVAWRKKDVKEDTSEILKNVLYELLKKNK